MLKADAVFANIESNEDSTLLARDNFDPSGVEFRKFFDELPKPLEKLDNVFEKLLKLLDALFIVSDILLNAEKIDIFRLISY